MHAPYHKYESSDSVVYLDRVGRTGSSIAGSFRGKTLSDVSEDNEATHSATPLRVAVAVRRGRLLLLTALVVVVIASIILVLLQGVDLTQIDGNSKNATDRTKLLDKYNSYSGNVASAFSRPIEIVMTVLAQLITLRFMAQAYTQPTISWRQLAAPIAISTGVGYLVTNGFNAVNVQLRDLDVQAVILTSDLSMPSNLSQTLATGTTIVTQTVSETAPNNLVSNTVLRNAVLSRIPTKQTICDWGQTMSDKHVGNGDRKDGIPLPTIDYGFTQRDWQSRILQTALPATTLKVVVNPTDKTINNNVKSADLPMNASRATDLFLFTMTIAPQLFP